MTNEQTQVELPELKATDHPDVIGGIVWSPLERRAIQAYATAAILADRERRAAKDAGAGDELPAGWVPLRIVYAPGEDPEDVAFGPKLMMDRLKKWLDKHFATLAEKPDAAAPADQAVERMLHDFPALSAFYARHALGPALAPSCLCCGQVPEQVAIRHMELPGIVICKQCRDAATTPPAPAAPVSRAVREYARQLVERLENAARNCGNWHGMYQGKPMPHDVYEQFSSVRDRTIPELRAELLAILAATQQAEPSAKDDNPWLPHNGGPCPVAPDALVDVKFRGGHISFSRRADVWDWTYDYALGDIIEYRLHREGGE